VKVIGKEGERGRKTKGNKEEAKQERRRRN
jgi:hypothetical protein